MTTGWIATKGIREWQPSGLPRPLTRPRNVCRMLTLRRELIGPYAQALDFNLFAFT